MEWFLVGMAIAIVVLFGFCLWLALSAMDCLPWQDEGLNRLRRINRKIEAKARENLRHQKVMRSIKSS